MNRAAWQLLFLVLSSLVVAACGGEGEQRAPLDAATDVADAGPLDVSDAAPDVVEPDTRQDEDTSSPGFADGRACSTDDECGGGVCLTGPEWPDGYCTTPGCESCPGRCLEFEGAQYCARECNQLMRCRDGYGCGRTPTTDVTICIGPIALADGEACSADDECYSGTCELAWADGYCTRRDCSVDQDCAPFGPASFCVGSLDGVQRCLQGCSSSENCRDGYRCQRIAGHSVCAPPWPEERVMLANEALPFVCEMADGPQLGFDYQVSEDAISYFLVPFSVDGQDYSPEHIELPDGEQIAFDSENDFQAIDSLYVDGINPVMVAATDQHLSQLQSGGHRYVASGTSDAMCHYMLEKQAAGSAIDLNIYLVGLTDLDATSAPSDPQFQAVLAEFNRVFRQTGLTLDEVRYNSLPEHVESRFEFIRSSEAIANLVEHSNPPGDTLEDALSLNVFLVRDIVGSVLGISQGIPGPAGLHGAPSSGIVVAADYYDQEPEWLGQVIAHEAGHYMGLFHTTETNRRYHDPLADTPDCDDLSTCEARENLMFPYALQRPPSLTRQQAWVLRMNPLAQVSPDPGPCGECSLLEKCIDDNGTLSCVCAEGLRREGGDCVDIDECDDALQACGPNTVCHNSYASYACECADGFEAVGESCVDIDECAQNPCAADAVCQNSPGSFTCTCNEGYAGDGFQCTDIDECATGALTCDALATCFNEPGTAYCECPVGYVGDGTSCAPYVDVPSRIAAGSRISCGLDSTDQIVCWGRNWSPHAGTFTQIVGGYDEFCALASNGTVACWEYSNGWTGGPTGTFSAIDKGSSFSCGLDTAGTLQCWGFGAPTVPSGTFVDVSAGSRHACGLRSDGTIACSGTISGSIPSGPHNAVYSVADIVCGHRTDGTIACSSGPVGLNNGGVTLETYVTVRTSADPWSRIYMCGIQADGTTHCWNRNGRSTLSSRYVDVGVDADDFGCGITTAGVAECWGGPTTGSDTPPANFP